MIDADEILRRLRFYAASEAQRAIYEEIRTLTIDYVSDIAGLLPESREKSHWLTIMEDAQMWANKSIAVNKAYVQ